MIDVAALPQVALDCLNKDHLDVANMINLLEETLPNATPQEREVALADLCKHLQDHFACEEKQMSKYSFPALSLHQQEHVRVLAEFTQQTVGKSGSDIGDYLKNTFCPWLVDHIATLDTQTARYIVASGGS